jgi:hypothetical protein
MHSLWPAIVFYVACQKEMESDEQIDMVKCTGSLLLTLVVYTIKSIYMFSKFLFKHS